MSSSEASRAQSPSLGGQWGLALHHTGRAVVKTFKGFRRHPILMRILVGAGLFGAGLAAPYVGGWLRRVVPPAYQRAKEITTAVSDTIKPVATGAYNVAKKVGSVTYEKAKQFGSAAYDYATKWNQFNNEWRANRTAAAQAAQLNSNSTSPTNITAPPSAINTTGKVRHV